MTPDTYRMIQRCRNCGHETVADVKCGVMKREAEREMVCPICACVAIELRPVDSPACTYIY